MVAPTQSMLFDDEATKSTSVVEVLGKTSTADKAQTEFRRLAGKLEQRREALGAWRTCQTRFQQRLGTELMPLEREYSQVRRALVLLFDEMLGTPKAVTGKAERAKLKQLVIDFTWGLLQEGEDPELVALHDKHSKFSHSEGLEKEMALSKAMIERMTGIDLGDDHSAKNFEDLLAKAAEEMQRQAAEHAEEHASKQKSRRQSAKARAAESKQLQAAQEASQTVREIYRKLASSLHPDREADALLREQKTEQMQRANQAYRAGDLLTLLSLQLEIEQIDADHFSTLPRQRLAHYNRVLKEQIAEIDAEIQNLIAHFRMAARLPPFARLTPGDVDRKLNEDIAGLRFNIADARKDLAAFRDPVQLNQFLKAYHPDSGWNEDEFFDFEGAPELNSSPRRARKRKK